MRTLSDNSVVYFTIAKISIRITFESDENGTFLIPSFKNFRTLEDTDTPHINIIVGRFEKEEEGKFIDDQDTDSGSVSIEKISVGYRYLIKDHSGRMVCRMEGNKRFTHCRCELYGNIYQRSYGLKSALIMAYSYAASFHNTFILHSSAVIYEDRVYCFLGESGTGKSTHSDLWVKNISGSKILNDDNPIAEVCGDKIYIYGSPWSGKRHYYINTRAELGAFVEIARAGKDSIEHLSNLDSLQVLYPVFSCFQYNKAVLQNYLKSLERMIELSDVYRMHCLPDDNAAIVCCKGVTKKKLQTV